MFGKFCPYLTFCSNPTITVVISSGQEALGLLICQDASTGRKPLEEKPATHTHTEVQDRSWGYITQPQRQNAGTQRSSLSLYNIFTKDTFPQVTRCKISWKDVNQSCNSQRFSDFRCFCAAREHNLWWAMTVMLKATSAPRSWINSWWTGFPLHSIPSGTNTSAKTEQSRQNPLHQETQRGKILWIVEAANSTHLSSSSSIKPLPSLSRMAKAFFTSWGLFWVRPQAWKNFLGQKVSGAGGGQRTAPGYMSVFGVSPALFCFVFSTKLELTPCSISTFSDS